MIEEEKMGFFVILDGACKAPQPSVEAFMQELFKQHSKNSTLHLAKQPGSGNARGGPKTKNKKGPKDKFDGFMINHFADDVTYDGTNFLMKNMEAVHPDTAKMLQESKIELVKQVAVDQGSTKKKAKLSVTGTFNRGIKTLMKNLKATEPFFVRCVNPNMQKSATIWSEEVVEHQLRCGGLVEALKVLKLGYPTRVPYSTLYEKYHGSVTNPLIKNMGPESFSTALLIAFDVSEEDYELGLTKIFFKPSKAAVLDTIMSQAGQPLSHDQNVKITKWVVQKRIKQIIGTCKAFLELRKRVRLARAAQRWQYAGRVVAILGGAVCRHLILARDAILKRKREQGAVAMQSFFRGSYECGRYRSHIIKVRKATKMIWISYRRWNERGLLKKWLEVKVIETRKRKEEERRKMMEDEERRKAEEKRLALEKARLEEEERLRDEQRKRQEAARLKAEEEERKVKEDLLLREKEEAMKRQAQASLKLTETKKEEEVKKKKEEREKRDESIKIIKKNRKNEEEDRRHKVEKAYRKKNFPEKEDNESDSDEQGSDKQEEEEEEEESDNEVPVKPVASLKDRLKQFDKIAQTGQLFLKYTGKRRRKPQDRIVKVSFDDQGKPKQISWGSGSRHIDFSDIIYVAYGHYTPVFLARKDQLDANLCFSVVGKTQILDVQAQTKDMAELWVKGLRKLIGQTDDKADQLAKESMEKGNLPGTGASKEKSNGTEKQVVETRTTSLMLLQQDLFVMTTTTVFRNLEEERIWEIDQSVRDKFNAKSLYEQALQNDVPWRQWNQWIRDRIVTYLKENNKMIQTQSTFSPYGQPYLTPQIQQPYMTPQIVQRTQNIPMQQPIITNYPQYAPNVQQQYNPNVQQIQYNPNLQQNQQNQQNQDNCSIM